MRPLSKDEKEAMYVALGMRSAYIETGDVTIRAQDLENMGKAAPRDIKVKALSIDQMKLIIKNAELVKAVIEGRVFIQEKVA